MQSKPPVGQTTDNALPTRIADILIERIITGKLQPGEWIRQDAVAAEFGASHVPVREAFRRIEARGLLVSEPRRGVRVADLDRSSIIEVTRIRAAMEPLALRHAIPAITAEDMLKLEAAIAAGDQATGMQEWEAANRTFHETLYTPCAMRRVLASIREMHEIRLRYMYATAGHINWDPGSQHEHQLILQSVRSGDVDRACELVHEHVVLAGELLINALDQVLAKSQSGKVSAAK
ncbi:GntR family transcriptional regulator [Undibacterium sp.]|uniref:GntR family transcriptional regulator n=1 Tax=Undibacterium sp. TaxID=1914977 RepID=UPI00374D6B9B